MSLKTLKRYIPSSSPSAESCIEFGFPDNVYTRNIKIIKYDFI